MVLTIEGNGIDLVAFQHYVNENRWLNINFVGHVCGEEKIQLLEIILS